MGMLRLWGWFKYTVLTLALLATASLFFLLTSQEALETIADKYAPKYGIAYQHISGTLLEGIRAEKVTFEKHLLADKLLLDWDLFSLLSGVLKVQSLALEGLEAKNLQTLFETLPFDENKEYQRLPFPLQIDTIQMSVTPFEESDIGFRKIILKGEDFEYNDKYINLSSLFLTIDSNVTKIELNGSLYRKKVKISKLDILDIDTKAFPNIIKHLISINFPQEVVDHVEPEIEDYKAHRKHLLPSSVEVESVRLKIKPAYYPQISLNKGEWKTESLFVNVYGLIDLKPRSLQYGKMDLLLDSNLSTLNLSSKWQGERVTLESLSLKECNTRAWKKLIETVGDDNTSNKKPFTFKMPKESEFPYLPKELLLKHFDADIKSTDLGSVTLSKAEVNASDVLLALQTLEVKKGEAALLIDSSLGKLSQHSTFKKGEIRSTGSIENRALKDLTFEHTIRYDRNSSVEYEGEITLGSVEGFDHNISDFFDDLNIDFKGDLSKIKMLLENNESQITAEYLFEKKNRLALEIKVPEDSKIRSLFPKLNVDALSPLEANVSLEEKTLHIEAKTKELSAAIDLDRVSRELQGHIDLGSTPLLLTGNVNSEIHLQHNTSSLKTFLKKLGTLYSFPVVPIEGDAKLLLTYTKEKGFNLDVSSERLIYSKDDKTIYRLDNTKFSIGYRGDHKGEFTLKHYATQYEGDTYYARHPSVLTLKEEELSFAPLWLNDTLKVSGYYNLQSRSGEISALADSVTFPLDRSELTAAVNVKSTIEKGAADMRGKVTVLGGNIEYDINLKTFATDRDIVSVQEEKQKKKNPFFENLSALVEVQTDKAFHYHNEEADIHAKADLLIQKKRKEALSLLGTVEIKKGSTYRIKKKKLIFGKSYIYFIGELENPYLDVVLYYKTVETKITMQIRGKLSDPKLIFHSVPYMNKRQILSTILFNTQDDIPDIDEDKMVHMMGKSLGPSLFSNVGGAVVKSVFSNIGINVDSIPFVGRSREANATKKSLMGLFSFEEKKESPSHFIHFIGQKEISVQALQEAMGVRTKPFWKFWSLERPRIDDKLLPTLKASLKNFYDSEGFYAAKISLRTTANDVYVQIIENLPVRVSSVKVQSDHESAKIFAFKKGQRFRSEEFVNDKRKIHTVLMKEGYCSYDMQSKAYVDVERHEAALRLNLKKGGVCTFGKVNIKTFPTIKNDIILSRLRVREGERYNTDLITKSYDALYGLESFDAIFLSHERKFYNVVPLEVEGKEISRPWFVKGAIDFDTEVGFRLNAEVLRTNFMGDAKNLRLALTYSKIEKEIALSYFVPAWLHLSDYYLDLTTKLGYRDFEYTGFIEEKTYFKSYVSYNDEKWHFDAGLAEEGIDISPKGDSALGGIDAGDFSTLYPFINFHYDSRIFRLRPESGYYLGAELEYALPYSESASTYLKYTLEGSATASFRDFSFTAVGKAGVLDDKGSEVPESKRFFAGGYGSNRAYGYQRVGVSTSSSSFSSEGASTMANLTLEAAYTVNSDLYTLLFMDNTMLAKEAYDFNGDVLSSLGVGLYYVTPISPIRIDIGMNIHDSSQYAIHFQLGESF